tara:strand:+ start:73848 stop:75569 length:1722 start_codon:yes stop_codon:yes gene_type:complete
MNINPKHYWRHFGFQHDPFPTDGQADVYLSTAWQQYLTFLENLEHYRNALLLVVGPNGIGKSTLRQQFVNKVSGKVKSHVVNATSQLGAEHISEVLASAFGMEIVSENHNVYDTIDKQLAAMQETGQQYLLVIDNAEKLPLDAEQLCLYMIKHQVVTQACMRVVLFGNESLVESFEQLIEQQDDSINNYVVNTLTLQPLDRENTQTFVEQRLAQAGYDGKVTLFSPVDYDDVYEQSQGLPAAVNHCAREFIMTLLEELYPSVETVKPRQKTVSSKQWKKYVNTDVAIHAVKRGRWWIGVVAVIAVLLLWVYPAMQRHSLRNISPVSLPPEANTVQHQQAMKQLADRQQAAEAVKQSVKQPVNPAAKVKPVATKPMPTKPVAKQKMVRLIENGQVKWVPAAQIEKELHPEHVALKKPSKAKVVKAVKPVAPKVTKPKTVPMTKLQPAKPVLAPVVDKSIKPESIVKAEVAPIVLTATEQRLLKVDSKMYTLQLMVASSADLAQAFVNKNQLASLATTYRMHKGGKTLYVVTLGFFPSRKAALDSVPNLNAKVAALKPWPRSFASVHQDIATLRS